VLADCNAAGGPQIGRWHSTGCCKQYDWAVISSASMVVMLYYIVGQR
jgi:hypothetical protein